MTRICRIFAAGVAIAVCSTLCAPQSADAAMLVQWGEDGGALSTLVTGASGSSVGGVFTVGDFTLNISASSNSPGAPNIAKLLSSTLTITNNSGTFHTLNLTVGDIDFTAPITPPSIKMNSHVGGSVVQDGASNTMLFQSYVDTANGQNSLTGITTGPQTPSITTGSFNDSVVKLIPILGPLYSISQKINVGLNGGSEVNYSSNTTLTPTPEPSTLALAGLGALGLIGYGIRRRRGA